MRNLFRAALVLLPLTAIGLPQAGGQIQTTAYSMPGFPSIESYQFANGLNLVVWPDPAAKQVGVNLWYRVGSLHEKPGSTGIAHLFEHMMLRPSKYAPLGGLAFERTMGAEIGATTRFRTTNFYTTFLPEKLEKIIQYQADIMRNLPLDAEMLANEKKAVRSEYLNWDNSPFLAVLPSLAKHAYPGHSAESFVTGVRPDLNKITVQDCREFYRNYYAPNNAVLVVTGKVEPSNVIAKVEHYFGSIQRGTDARLPPDLQKLPNAKTITQTVPGDSHPVVVTFPIPFSSLPSKEGSALKLAFEITFKGNRSLAGTSAL
ncbi:MAG: insulinase family protein [Pseudobdellovibrionaceae bacterium]|nr:insulinase family protein [Pseudobdellovibrionaceae bacterium]